LKNAVQPEIFNETPGSKGVSLTQTRVIQRAAKTGCFRGNKTFSFAARTNLGRDSAGEKSGFKEEL
jgi:hypothetical protein